MNKAQIALSLGAIALILVLYQMPRVVVENETIVDAAGQTHTFSIPQEVRTQISTLRSMWGKEADIEKKANFADSLAGLYLDYQELDSVIWFVDFIKESDKEGREVRIADLLYRAFQRTSTAEDSKRLGKLAGDELRSLLEQYPESSSLKNRLAMTLVVTDNPMQGIQLLRELVEENPNDLEAIKNLGILSIQSGQFARAEDRFTELLKMDSTDLEAKFYLGMSRIEQGNEEGYEIMEELSKIDINPAIQQLAMQYLVEKDI